MRLLLDTCIFLWLISGDNRLGGPLHKKISDPNNEVFLSTVSIWESIVKYQIGRLSLPEPPSKYIPKQRERHSILSLPLDEASVIHLSELPSIHRDPFDRMLVCQALEHHLTLVTVDNIVRSYPVETI